MSAVSEKTKNQMIRFALTPFNTAALRKFLHAEPNRKWRCHAYAELLWRKHARRS